MHEVSLHLFLVHPELVLGDEPVAAVVEVRGAVQLQAAVILSLGEVVDHRHYVESFDHQLIVLEPLELRLWVSWTVTEEKRFASQAWG